MWSQLTLFVIVVSFGRTHVTIITCWCTWYGWSQLSHFPPNYHQLPEVPQVQPEIGIIWSFFQNYYHLPKVPLVQPKIGIKWSFSQNYYQLPEVPLVQPKIGIIWSFSQNYHQLPRGTPGAT